MLSTIAHELMSWLGTSPGHALLMAFIATLFGMIPGVAVAAAFPMGGEGERGRARARAAAVAVTAALVGGPFFWALLCTHGDVQEVFVVEGERGPRVATFYQSTGRGTTCTLRVVDPRAGELVGFHRRSGRCKAPTSTSRYLWFTDYSLVSGNDLEAFDLYTGEVVTNANDLAEARARRHPEVGEARVSGPDELGVVEVSFQDGSTRWVVAGGALLEEKPSRAEPTRVPSVRSEHAEVELEGLRRARRIDSTCGCAGSPEGGCGALVVYSSTAFGDGVTQIGVHDGGGLAWSWSMPELGFAPTSEPLGARDVGGACMLVVSGRKEWIPKSIRRFLSPSNSGVVFLDLATGEVTSSSPL